MGPHALGRPSACRRRRASVERVACVQGRGGTREKEGRARLRRRNRVLVHAASRVRLGRSRRELGSRRQSRGASVRPVRDQQRRLVERIRAQSLAGRGRRLPGIRARSEHAESVVPGARAFGALGGRPDQRARDDRAFDRRGRADRRSRRRRGQMGALSAIRRGQSRQHLVSRLLHRR